VTTLRGLLTDAYEAGYQDGEWGLDVTPRAVLDEIATGHPLLDLDVEIKDEGN